jgi:hypothetical protein
MTVQNIHIKTAMEKMQQAMEINSKELKRIMTLQNTLINMWIIVIQ